MAGFTRITAPALPIARPNCDTDQIIPARFLRKSRKDGLADYLFHDLRYHPDGIEIPAFIMNQAACRDARIIVADRNFGCGSSREHAVWALHDAGFRAAIAPSFGDIFHNNSFKNFFLPVVLPPAVVADLLAQLAATPGAAMTVDLPTQTVTAPNGDTHPFDIDPFAKHCMLNGVDELGYTLTQSDQIDAFEHRYGRENV